MGLANYSAGISQTIHGLGEHLPPTAISALSRQALTSSRFHPADDTYDNYHTYVLDWQEDQLQWTVDGDVKQTLLKSDTLTADGTM